MEISSTLGEVRNLLAGLRCSQLETVPGTDDTPVRLSTAFLKVAGGGHYILAVDIDFRPQGGRARPRKERT